MWDLSLPGYKYLGPGNKLNKGKPTNYNDRVAKLHDEEYDQLIKSGKRPYTQWNTADENFLKRIKLNDYGGLAGYSFFGIKRGFHKLGLIPSVDTSVSKRLRGDDISPLKEKQKRLRGAPDQPSGRDDNTSLLNTTTSANMADGGGSGNAAGLRETPVDDPYIVYRGPPDYTFCSLPFMREAYFVSADYYAYDHVFRMTSPYDPVVETQNADINVGLGTVNVRTENDSAGEKARWFDMYAGMYSYYHVVSCQYTVMIENFSGEPLWVYQMFYNESQPPTGATNQDMQLWSGTKYKYCDRRYLGLRY